MLRFDGKNISNVLYKDVHLNYTGVVETRMQWFLMKNTKPKNGQCISVSGFLSSFKVVLQI